MHFILVVELKQPPTGPSWDLGGERADNGTCKRSEKGEVRENVSNKKVITFNYK